VPLEFPSELPLADRAIDLQADAQALWAAESNRLLRDLAGENHGEAGYCVAAELDGLRRMLRGDLCDRIPTEEWNGRRV